MAVWQAIILGLIEGLAVFLPISGTGHLSIAEHVLGTPESGALLMVMFHLGALLAIIGLLAVIISSVTVRFLLVRLL